MTTSADLATEILSSALSPKVVPVFFMHGYGHWYFDWHRHGFSDLHWYFLVDHERHGVENGDFHGIRYWFFHWYWNVLLYGVRHRYWYFYWDGLWLLDGVRDVSIHWYFDWIGYRLVYWVRDFLDDVHGVWLRDVNWVRPVYFYFDWVGYDLLHWVRFGYVHWYFDGVRDFFFHGVGLWDVDFVRYVDGLLNWIGLRY